jgi:hypothetical protein
MRAQGSDEADRREAAAAIDALRAACAAPSAALRAKYADLEAAVLAAELRAPLALGADGGGSAAAGRAGLAAALPDALAALRRARARCGRLCTPASPTRNAELVRLLGLGCDAGYAHFEAAAAAALAALRRLLLPSPAGAEGAGARAAAERAWAQFGELAALLAAVQSHCDAVCALASATDLPAPAAPPAGARAAGGAERSARALLEGARALCADAAFAPLGAQLAGVSRLAAWAAPPAGSGGGAFSRAPLAHATAIGEHLLLMPQAVDGTTLLALRALAGEAVPAEADASECTFGWLEGIATRLVTALLAEASLISSLSAAGQAQLAADVGYVKMVLSSGLGLDAEPRLVELEAALAADADGAELGARLERCAHLPPALARALGAARAAGGAHEERGPGTGEAASSAFEI